MALTSEAKRLLAETIRGTQQDPAKGLRARLLRDLHDEADRRYRFSVPITEARARPETKATERSHIPLARRSEAFRMNWEGSAQQLDNIARCVGQTK
jgi:hypothetical protein